MLTMSDFESAKRSKAAIHPGRTPASQGYASLSRSARISAYRSGRSPDWLKMKNSGAPAVKRE
jgi:hypothetical protein